MFALDDLTLREASFSRGLAVLLAVVGSLAYFRLYVFLTVRQIVYWTQGQHKKRQANVYLQGNFAPTHSTVLEQDLKVIGKVGTPV